MVTDVALSYLQADDMLSALLVRVTDALESDTAAILLYDDTTNELVARAAKGIEEEVEQSVRIPLGRGFAGKIAAERRPVVLDEVDHSNVMNPILREKGIRSLLGVPLLVQNRLLGVMHVGTLTPRLFTESDVALMRLVADRVALAVQVGLYERERMITETLQRTFLPESLPAVVGVDFIAKYIPASTTGVGGDWYDVFTLPNGLTIVIVGDVVGHGLVAASVMGRLRNALRAYAIMPLSPTEIVEQLNTLLQYFDREDMSTLIFSVVDTEAREITIVNAGHLPPVMHIPGEPAFFLETPPIPPLGARMSLKPIARTFPLPAGAMVFFYTDGLVERRTVPLTESLESLRRIFDNDVALPELADVVLRELTASEPDDDVAFLALRTASSISEPYRIVAPAHPSELGRIRGMLRAWLSEQRVPPDMSYDVTVAVGEAVANAVEHAYGAEAGEVEMTLFRSDTALTVSVHDRGNWRGPRGRGRGRGLPMMQKLASSVDVVTTEDGTHIQLSWRLPRGDPRT